MLHVPYTFFPDQSGGTETYVASLAAGLRNENIDSAIAAPADRDAAYEYNGIAVYRFARAGNGGLEQAYGVPDETAAQSFNKLLQRVRPRIVHLHANTAAVSYRLADAAIAAGAKIFFTYHTPTVSCLRGDMMHMGKSPCDGILDERRCTMCVLQKHGLPPSAGRLLSRLPVEFAQALERTGCSGGAFTAFRMRKLVADAHGRIRLLMDKADCIVAVCQWVLDVLRANGVTQSKLVLCRQGLGAEGATFSRAKNAGALPAVSLRLSYFGRLEPAKGVDIIIDALKLIPDAHITFDVYGIIQPGWESYAYRLKKAADPRVHFHAPLPPDAVPDAMAHSDLVSIPSRWLETGPLVAYEAFAAGTPVLGTRLGGIAELVSDGVDGVLVDSDEPRIWSGAIFALAQNRESINRLRRGVRPPRTMRKAAGEMAEHYQRVLAIA